MQWSLQQVAAEHSIAYMRGQMQGIDRVETPDARTVRIIMKQPTVTLPLWLAAYEMPIVAQGSGSAPVGCGPFVIAAQDRGVSITLAPWDKFYRPGLPKLPGVDVIVYADETARVAALQAGDVDLIEYVPWQSMAGIEADPKLKLETVDGPVMYVTFNGATGPFTDPRVRLAVSLAIRRDEIVKSAFFGRGAADGRPADPALRAPSYDDGARAPPRHYDPDPRQGSSSLKRGHQGRRLLLPSCSPPHNTACTRTPRC